MSALVVPSGECLQGEGLVWMTEAVVCSLAAYHGSNGNGRPHLALQHHWLLPINWHFESAAGQVCL